ncbi:hybrid sensor histidine kinase/response regulator [Nitrosomonas sp. wSCUT-2]
MIALLAIFSLACIGYIVYLRRRCNSSQESMRVRAIEAIIQTTRYGVIETDLNGTILIFNPAAEKMLGYRAEEVIGKLTPAIIHVPEEIAVRAIELGIEPSFDVFVKNPREKREVETREWTYIRKDRSTFVTYLSISALRDGNDHLIGYVGVFEDITALKEWQKAQQMKDEFLANVSHELRTPLNAVMGLSALIKAETDYEKIRNYAQSIHLSGSHLRDIVNELLDFSKMQAGKFQIEKARLPLIKVFKDCHAILLGLAEEKRVNLRFDYQKIAEDCYVEGDEIRLKQIVNNIASNAIKFSEDGIVEICAGYRDGLLSVIIKDNGIGMNAEVVRNLFKPFYQADGSITRKFGGTGLGLAISKNIIDKMGGSIKVESAIGKGSTFILSIPLSPAPELHNRITNENPLHKFDHRFHVLIAEDNVLNQLILEQILLQFELNVTKAGNGKEALDLALENEFDLILMDMQMPGMDGLQSTQMLREKGILAPVIACTANAYQDDRTACIAAGMNDFITKPIDISALNALLIKYLSAQQQSQQNT